MDSVGCTYMFVYFLCVHVKTMLKKKKSPVSLGGSSGVVGMEVIREKQGNGVTILEIEIDIKHMYAWVNSNCISVSRTCCQH